MSGKNTQIYPPQLKVGCAQSVGKQRDHMEDALFSMTFNLAGGKNVMPVGLFAVADGMGGHERGEVASEIAIRTVSSWVIKKIFSPSIKPKPSRTVPPIEEILERSFQEAHNAIVKTAPESGTTLTVLAIMDGLMTIAHVGDSRVYAITPDGCLISLTTDHSLVRRMIDAGQLSEVEAASHPQRNILYRALGQGEVAPADINTVPFSAQNSLLLCSDGLWGVVAKETIARITNTHIDPQLACQLLVEAAEGAGGPDNITAILVRSSD
jgi:serine/threonine protein phosphatase PrpC